MSFYKIFQTKENGEVLLSKSFSPEYNFPILAVTYLTDLNDPNSLSISNILPFDPNSCETEEEFMELFNEVFETADESLIQSVINSSKRQNRDYFPQLDERNYDEDDNYIDPRFHEAPETKQ